MILIRFVLHTNRLPSLPFPWFLALRHQSLAFFARLDAKPSKNEAPEEEEEAAFRGFRSTDRDTLFKKRNSEFYTLHNYDKIIKSDWLSAVLISALKGQCNRTVRVITRAHLNGFFFSHY